MAQGGMSLPQQFVNFSKFTDPKSDGKKIILSSSDMWMKQAKVLDGKTITTTDTGIVFNQFKTRGITFEQYLQFIDDLAERTNQDPQIMKDLLTDCGLPGQGTQKAGGGIADGK